MASYEFDIKGDELAIAPGSFIYVDDEYYEWDQYELWEPALMKSRFWSNIACLCQFISDLAKTPELKRSAATTASYLKKICADRSIPYIEPVTYIPPKQIESIDIQ